jgi:O-antigen ligase
MFVIYMLTGELSSILGTSDKFFMLKPVLLLMAMAVIIAVAGGGWAAISAMRLGLTISGFAVVLFHFVHIDFSRLLSPTYRIFLFLNPNGVCYVSMVTGLSLIDYFLQRRRQGRTGIRGVGILLLTSACVIVCLATKSRTGTLALLLGLVITAFLSMPTKQFLIRAIGLTVAVAILAVAVPGAIDSVARVFQLNDKYRAVATGTGRFETWSHAIEAGFVRHPIIGMGLGSEYFNPREIGHIHNALLAFLFDTGLIGTVPILLVLAFAARRCFRMRGRPEYHFAIAIFWACLFESCGESMLFSMGNPAGLLFILAVVILTREGVAECLTE